MRVPDARWDFRGGLDTTSSPDIVSANHVRNAQNLRLTTYGALEKRAGSQRLHTDQIASDAADPQAIIQWVPDSGTPQIVAISNGKLYYMNEGSTTFTEVTPTQAFNTSNAVRMVPYKTAGSNDLYIVDGQSRRLYHWDGSSLTEETNHFPAEADNGVTLEVYRDRVFSSDNSRVTYSPVHDPQSNWTDSVQVETSDGDAVNVLLAVGNSLVVVKQDSIARYTGVTPDTVSISKLTSGISSDVGCLAPLTCIRYERGFFFLSDRGPYIGNESGVEPVGRGIRDQFDSLDKDNRVNAVAVDNRRRQEIWIFAPSDGSSTNDTGWIWNYELNAWTGPLNLSYDVKHAARYERADGTESIMLCGYDSRIRDGDVVAVGAKDDVTVAGSGGTNVTAIVELPTLFFGDPRQVASLTGCTQEFSANLGTNGSVTVGTSSNVLTTEKTLTVSSDGDLTTQYQFRPFCYGERITVKLTEATAEITVINGVQLEAKAGRRVA